MPTLRELLNVPGIGLTLLVGEDRLDDELRWVATSEHLDPTPFLEGGELLLTTGIQLPRTARSVQEYVDRLVTAGVIGVGFGVGLAHDSVPSRLVAAVERAGAALVEVDGPTPFVAVTKAVSDLHVKEQNAETLRFTQAQHDLVRTAVREGSSGVVGTLARLVDGWAILLDGDGAVQLAEPAAARRRAAGLADEIARLTASGPTAASVVEQGQHLSLETLTMTRRVRGYIICGMPRRPSQVDRGILAVATALLALTHPRDGREDQARSAAVLRLARSGTVTDAGLLADLGGPLLRRPEVHVIAATGSIRQLDALAGYLDDEPPEHALHSRDGDRLVALLSAGRLGDVLDQARRARVLAGVSDAVGQDGLVAGFAQAERALEVAAARGVPALSFADAMPGPVALADPADTEAWAGRLLGPLEEYGARTDVDLLANLQAWLRHHGLFEPAAAELGIHRHTLRHRVRRAERLLGKPLDDPDTRMELWFALRVRHSGQR